MQLIISMASTASWAGPFILTHGLYSLFPNMELCIQLYQSIHLHLIYLEIQICVTLVSKNPKPACMGYYISPRNWDALGCGQSHSKAAPTGSSSHLELHLDLPVCHLLILLTFATANLYHTSLNCHWVLSQTPYKSLGCVASTSELVNLEWDQKNLISPP